MSRWDNPVKEVVERIRQIILASDDRIEEIIKWDTPTFVYKGDLASFFPKATHHAVVMFHHGAKIPGSFPHLEGKTSDGRVMRIVSIAEAEERRDELNAIVQSWIAWRDSARP